MVLMNNTQRGTEIETEKQERREERRKGKGEREKDFGIILAVAELQLYLLLSISLKFDTVTAIIINLIRQWMGVITWNYLIIFFMCYKCLIYIFVVSRYILISFPFMFNKYVLYIKYIIT